MALLNGSIYCIAFLPVMIFCQLRMSSEHFMQFQFTSCVQEVCACLETFDCQKLFRLLETKIRIVEQSFCKKEEL